MAYELMKEKIIVDEKIGKETTQILIEGDLIVPDVKPDMAVVLQTDADVFMESADAGIDRVSFAGKLNVSVLYLARGSEKPVHNMSITSPIDDFINVNGITKEMWVEAKAQLASIDFKMVNDRKVSYKAVVDVLVSCDHTNEHEIVVDIKELNENQLLKNSLTLNKRIENKCDKISIKDEFAIPAGKPNVREILQCEICIANKEVKTSNGKVIISGELTAAILYRGDNESSLIEFVESEIPFNGSVDVSAAREDMIADVTLQITDKHITVRPDSDGEERVLEVDVNMCTTVKVHCQETMEILEDAHCINKVLDISKTPVKYPKLVCRNKNQTPIKEVFKLGDSCPDILQIFKAKGFVKVSETKIMEDRVVVEGFVEANVLYVAQDDQMPLYSHNVSMPFSQNIDARGALNGMDVVIDTSVDHIGFNMLSGREMELRFMLSFNTSVIDEMEASMITDIGFEELDKSIIECMASMTVCVVQKNDTLLKIAKKYNTSVDEIVFVNDLEHGSKIHAGQKLLILKKVC